MTRALRTTAADLGAALAGIAVQIERDRSGLYIATEPGTQNDEFTLTGEGATPEEAVADLRDALGLDDEHREIDTDEADWIAPGGWDDEDGQPDEAQEWADYDRDC